MTHRVAEAASRGGVLAGLRRLFERQPRGDATAPAPESSPPDAAPEGAPDTLDRGDRPFSLPWEVIDRSLGGKVLEGWLQNRHQVLVPLTLRLGRLTSPDATLVMRFTAVAVLNATDAGPDARRYAERWLQEIGALADGLAPFHEAFATPPPLSLIVSALRKRDLGPYAYAAAVAAVDTRAPVARLFAGFIAARLDLPADAVRSIDRRSRR